ncbi:FRG domain-containing protein [Halomonas daqingensis]|uniref:FRG domain-containing protein n=1 Tax=Billgrantia desiderata TaxID=52021 RepID=A0AAW4YPB4_9GAMM|nr:FRG domain-containing protein [Halomonas desiderata]MCE8049826.1 FRG domain-containing protein [Halomonas desiderata]
MKKISVDSFVHYIECVEEISKGCQQVVFRGQGVEGNLLPGVARKKPSNNTKEEERKILDQLKLQGASLLNGAGDTDLDLLVLSQHYGLKTRLLDWTGNPLAALWFACTSVGHGDVYVYALEADNYLRKNVYASDPFSSSKTHAFQPRLNNARLVAQQGWFTLHRYSVKSRRFVPLERNPDVRKSLHEFHIPGSYKESLIVSLDRHGVSEKTLFPDINGLCLYLNRKFEMQS